MSVERLKEPEDAEKVIQVTDVVVNRAIDGATVKFKRTRILLDRLMMLEFAFGHCTSDGVIDVLIRVVGFIITTSLLYR